MANQVDPLIGRTLGEFVIEELIGEGGFGRVYRAEQPALQREAVIKVLRLTGDATEKHTDRFLREARLASRLDHPFAAHIYAFGAEPDNLLWIAMELVRGTPLDRILVEAPLEVERAIPFIRRLCEVVQTAHDQEIVHRDLKPANVMVLSRAGNVFPKLLDLGIAKDVTAPADAADAGSPLQRAAQGMAVTGPGQMGTPFYMAPEQWISPTDAGPAADIYALGVLTFEVLTGAPPFAGVNIIDIAKQHARTPPPALPDEFPVQLSEAIARAMGKRPADRFPSALAFADALVESSGIALDSVNLPTLDELTRDDVFMSAPQPIAETAAAFDAARNPTRALDALWDTVSVCAQYVGAVSLACRSRVGPDRFADSDGANAALAELAAGRLDAEAWWRLSRELARPFQTIADAHPVPELVGLFFDGQAELRTAVDELLKARTDAKSVGEARTFLAGAVPALAAALRSLRFLSDYPLAVPRAGALELWMGLRRPTRAAASAPSSADVTDGHPLLIAQDGTPVVSLWPAAEATAPSPNQPLELFLLAGAHRRGAVLTASPVGFERSSTNALEKLHIAAGEREADAAAAANKSPYLGLQTFTQDDADSFFGREREVEAFVNRLRQNALIAVVGPSGAGKSSFIRAGVLPALAGEWRPIIARPGPEPVTALIAATSAAGVDLEPAALAADLGALRDALTTRCRDGGHGIVLIIDQFEELFTLCHDEDQRDQFARALVAAARTVDDPLRVILTLRDDFLVRAVQVPALRDRLTGSLQVLATPVADDMRRILIEPARRAGYEFEDDALPDEMVAAVESEPGALALLSFTAYQLWQYRDRHFRKLPRKAYDALGGVGGALAQHAEATLDKLDEDARDIVREVFRHLITADGTRAVMSRDELLQVCGGDDALPALEALIGARLLTAMEGDGGDIRIEVVHEALLSAWPRVVGWRREDAHNARLRDQLRVAARQWHDRDRPRGLLWRGDALAELRLWRGRYAGSVTDTESEFATASFNDAARGRRIRTAVLAIAFAAMAAALIIFVQLRGTAETERERAQASATALDERLTESYQEQGRRAFADGDVPAAALYSAKALERGADSPALRLVLGRALAPLRAEVGSLSHDGGPIHAIRQSADGAVVVTASADGKVALWDGGSMTRQWSVSDHGDAAPVIGVSPDGSLLATWSASAGLRLFSLASKQPIATLEGHTGPVLALEFFADSKFLVSSSVDGTVRVWRAADGGEVGTLDVAKPGANLNFDIASSGAAIAVGTQVLPEDTGEVSVWTIDGERTATLTGHERGVWYVRFDPNGRRVASASADGTARVFDARSGSTFAVLRGHDNRVTDVRWSPSGKLLATASADNLIKLWDPATGASRGGLRGHTAQVNRIRFSSDGARLLSVGADGEALVWDPNRRLLLARLSHGGFVSDGIFTGDAEQAITVSQLGGAKVFRTTGSGLLTSFSGTAPPGIPEMPLRIDDQTLVHRGVDRVTWVRTGKVASSEAPVVTDSGPLTALSTTPKGGHMIAAFGPRLLWLAPDGSRLGESTVSKAGDPVTAVALAPSGKRAVTITAAGNARLVERGAAAPIATLALGRVASGFPWLLSWSPAGDLLTATAFGDPDRKNRLYRASDLSVVADLGTSTSAEFEPRVGRIATVDDQMVVLRDLSGAAVTTLKPSSAPILARFSADGARLLVGLADGGVMVVSSIDGATLGQLDAHDLFVPWVTTNESGTLIVTVGFDATVKIWSTASMRLLHTIRVAPGTNWATFLGDDRLATSNGPTIDVWSVSSYSGSAAELSRALRCTLPFRLDDLTVVPIADFRSCDPGESR